jgi:hypothetical protein
MADAGSVILPSGFREHEIRIINRRNRRFFVRVKKECGLKEFIGRLFDVPVIGILKNNPETNKILLSGIQISGELCSLLRLM